MPLGLDRTCLGRLRDVVVSMLPRPEVFCAALLALGPGGCAPGITHKLGIESRSRVCGLAMSPDGAHVAVGISVDQYHPPNALGAFPDGGIPIEVKGTLEVV